MATTTGNPWISTTAETVTTQPVRVQYMEWTPTTDGDDLSVTDNGGNVIWSLKAIAADSNQGIKYRKAADGGHDLRAVHQSESFRGFQMHRLHAASPQGFLPWDPPAVIEGFPHTQKDER